MRFLYIEIKKVIEYTDTELLIGLAAFLAIGLWFLYFGISGLLR